MDEQTVVTLKLPKDQEIDLTIEEVRVLKTRIEQKILEVATNEVMTALCMEFGE